MRCPGAHVELPAGEEFGEDPHCLLVALADGQGLGEVGGMDKVFSQNSGGRDGKGGRGGGTDMGQLLTTPMNHLPVPGM